MFLAASKNQSAQAAFRPTLLWTVTSLYVKKLKHSAEEEQQFTALVLGLLDAVDAQTRLAVSNKMLQYPHVPSAIRRRLLGEEIASGGFAESSSSGRDGCPAMKELSESFFSATAHERRLILLNLPYSALKPVPPIPAATSRDSSDWLEAAAVGHNGEMFAGELERTIGIPQALSRRMIDDPLGEPIVVIAVALGMPASVLKRILLCLNPMIGQAAQRLYDLARLHREIGSESALRLIAIWRATHSIRGIQARPAVTCSPTVPPVIS